MTLADALTFQHQQVPEDDRWTAVGSSRVTNSFQAGAQAANEASGTTDAALLIVFCGHHHDVRSVMEGIRSAVVPHAQIVGCTTGGEIALGGPRDGSVVVMAMGGDGLSIAARLPAPGITDLRVAGESVAGAVAEVPDRGHTVLMLLSDGLAGDQQEIVRGAHGEVGARVRLVGGCAGDGMEMVRTTLFASSDEDSYSVGGSVIGVAISSVAPIGIGVRHGWEPVGNPVLITGSTGNVVHTIDAEPALDRYLRLHGAPANLADIPDEFTRFAATHPLGIVRRSGTQVRFIATADPQARTISSIAEIPTGATAWAMEGTPESVLDATRGSCEQAIDQLDGPPRGLLAFDCVARRGVLLDADIADEIDRIGDMVGAPIAGFYTYGEIARVAGASGFHNQTLVTLAIG